MSTTVVTVEKTKTVAITKNEPEITTVVARSTVAAVAPSEPTVSEIERAAGEVDVVFAGQLGPRGPQGDQGPPGAIEGTTDQLVEGETNLYFTDERAGAVAAAAASASMSLHLSHPDPHAQYLLESGPIDGGNF